MIIQATINRGGLSMTARMDISAIIQVTQQIAQICGKPDSHTVNRVKQLGEKMHQYWSREAENKLVKSQSYVANLGVNQKFEQTTQLLRYHIEQNQLTEDGRESVAMLMEYGFDAFDMKEKILKGRKKVVIPFKHGNPGQKKYEPIPQDLHHLINEHSLLSGGKSLNHSDLVRLAGEELANRINPRKTKHFSSYSTISGRFGSDYMETQVANNRLTHSPFGKFDYTTNYTWKARKYDRMMPHKTQSGKKIENSYYLTLRTISKKSPSDSWIHPGVLPKMIFHTALQKLVPEIEPSLKKALDLDIEEAKKG